MRSRPRLRPRTDYDHTATYDHFDGGSCRTPPTTTPIPAPAPVLSNVVVTVGCTGFVGSFSITGSISEPANVEINGGSEFTLSAGGLNAPVFFPGQIMGVDDLGFCTTHATTVQLDVQPVTGVAAPWYTSTYPVNYT